MKRTIDECFFHIQNGANIKQGQIDGGFPITRIETISNNTFNRDRMGYAGITDVSKYKSYVLEDGDLLMSHINSAQYLGRTVLYEKRNDETIIHGMNLLRLKARSNIILPSFARYCFYGRIFKSQIATITKKSVNQASFAVKDLKQIQIDVPPIVEQNKIVHRLDTISHLIERENIQLAKLDTLVKSRFIEMFGDPVTNPMEWETTSIRDTSELISDGPFGSNLKSSHYVADGIRVIRLGNIGIGRFLDDDKAYISEEHYATLKKYTCHAGEIVIGTLGEPNLRACLIPDDITISVNKSDCVHFIPKADLLNNIYACAYLNTEGALQLAQGSLHGQTRSRIAMSQVAALPIMLPPLDLQNQFAAFVEQTDKSKAVLHKLLEKQELLRAALMQEYFGY